MGVVPKPGKDEAKHGRIINDLSFGKFSLNSCKDPHGDIHKPQYDSVKKISQEILLHKNGELPSLRVVQSLSTIGMLQLRIRDVIPMHILDTSAVAWTAKLSSKNNYAQALIRIQPLLEVKYHVQFSSKHFAGSKNVVADASSRLSNFILHTGNRCSLL